MSFKIKDSYESKIFHTTRGLVGHIAERGICVQHHPLENLNYFEDDGDEYIYHTFKSGRWVGKTSEVFSFAKSTTISINRATIKHDGLLPSEKKKAEKLAQENMTRIDINLESVFPSITLDDGTETSLVSDWIKNDSIKKGSGYVWRMKRYYEFFEDYEGHPEHVVVGYDAESEDDFLIVYALTTSPSSGWRDQIRTNVSSGKRLSRADSDSEVSFIAKHGELLNDEKSKINGKLRFILVTMKLDIKNRLREMSRKRKKRVIENLEVKPLCPSCNSKTTGEGNFCQICGQKLIL